MLDFTEQGNKKYIPIATFALGVFVGGLLMHFWVQKKSRSSFADGGTIQAQSPAPAALPPAAPVAAAPAMPAVAVGSSTATMTM